MSLHYRISHHWPVGPAPLRENYILNLLQYVAPSYKNYEYIDHERALERGYGICTQYSNALFDILEDEGFRRKVIQVPGHTLVEATTRGGKIMTLDANYGVVMPFSWEEIAEEPSIVRPYYSGLEPATRPNAELSNREVADLIERVLSEDPISILADRATPRTSIIEPIAYFLKWALPIGLLLLALVLHRGWPRPRAAARRTSPGRRVEIATGS